MAAKFYARDTLLTTKQAAEHTGLPPRTIKYLADHGRLRYVVLAGTARPKRWYRRSDLEALLVEPASSRFLR